MKDMKPISCAIAAACALLVPALAVAQQHPNLERGFAAEKVYQFGSIDNVNLFNGNVNVSIPIGQEYAVGGKVSYRLGLSYNSKVWDIEERNWGGVLTQALPNRRSNAGLGWQLSLGKLVPPGDPTNNSNPIGWVYVSPDGAEHVLYGSLHNGEVGTPGFQYTRSGTYLRMQDLSGGWHDLEFPDGTIHRFDNLHRLREIRDWFGNQVTVTYPDATTWKISEGLREHFVRFAVRTFGDQPVLFVDEVDLAAFGGQRAVYQFDYANALLERPPKNPLANEFCYDDDPETSSHTNVSLLQSVTLPDSSQFVFGYHLADPRNVCETGALASLRLPTLGSLEWDYATRTLPVEGCYPEYIDYWATRSPGVWKRRQRDAAGVLLGEWEYIVDLSASPPPAPGDDTCGAFGQYLPPEEVRTTVVTPLEDRTVHYFSSWPNRKDSINGFKRRDYGLPFTRLQPGAGNLLLSQQVADCDAAGNNCSLERSEYVRYEHDVTFNECRNDQLQECMDRNRRAAASRSEFHDDPVAGAPRYLERQQSDFDGLGHYRATQTTGNFDAGNVRSAVTRYNPARGTYPSSFSMVPTTARWILDTFDLQDEVEGGVTARRTFAVDPNTGWVNRTRIHRLDSGAASTNDVIVETTHSSGNLASERYYGGDVQTVNTGDLATLALPASPQYELAHTTVWGTRATSAYASGDPTVYSFKTLDCGDDPATGGYDPGIDASTGLPSKCRDTSRIATSYEYDAMGRLAWEKPESGHDGWTEYIFTRATAFGRANVTIRRRPNGGGGPLAESMVVYDSLGRLFEEHQLMPNGTWSVRQTLYNAIGWKSSVSERGDIAKKTRFESYDPFGRPGTVVAADDQDVVFTYLGVRSVMRRVKVGAAWNGSNVTTANAFIEEIYDRQGRLWRVKEPAEAGGFNTTTTYTYDVGNRLARVQQSTSAGTQNRWFTYDQRGFLLSEQHPEKGVAGNGVVSYSNYDARGHAGRKLDGPFDLTFDYDDAERLTLVRESGSGFFSCTNDGGRRCLKSFTYGTSNAAGVRTNGRLHVATRYNLVGPPYNFPAQVDETYTYGGRQGRVSHRTTQHTANGSVRSFAQTWTYTPLGKVDHLGYPDCTFTACTSSFATPRTVTHTYSNGWLTAIPGFATSISYHPNGLYHEVVHQNGTIDKQTNDVNSIARPGALATRRSLMSFPLWSSGAYAYDGAGNVTRMGNGYFLYDRVSRIVDGHVDDKATGGGNLRWQTYTFDPFGNLTNIGGDWGAPGRATPTAAATNRLSGGSYDAAGNLTGWNGNIYEYDAFGLMTKMLLPGDQDHRYTYTAADERLLEKVGSSGWNWAVRDLDGKVLREFRETEGWKPREYVYRDGQLLASEGGPTSFGDVPGTHPYAAEIEALFAAGVTTGCSVSPPLYCPDQLTPRWQMAVLLIRAQSGPAFVPPVCDPQQAHFTDVPCGSLAADWIYELYRRGITTGCTSTTFCPYDNVPPAQMAVFLLRALEGPTYQPPPCTSTSFSDYTCADNFAPWMEEVFRRGIDMGCGNGQFCPYQPFPRSRMAMLLARAFQLAYPDKGYSKHYHLDHLGTPRLITSSANSGLAFHAYFPFGEEFSSITQDTEQMKFTAHERDLQGTASVADDLDYMHARFYNPQLGRFLSTDPINSARPQLPQSWNRYAYAIGNPLKYVDPDGRSIWTKGIQVLTVLADREKRTVLLSAFRGKSERDALARTRAALDGVTQKELDGGVRRVVEVQNSRQRDAIARGLSTNGKFRGPEASKGWPEHVNPDEGPYADVHVQVQGQRASGSGRAAAGAAAGASAILAEIFAPTLSAVIESGEATPSELLSAAGWDVTSTLDPIFVTDLVGAIYDLP